MVILITLFLLVPVYLAYIVKLRQLFRCSETKQFFGRQYSSVDHMAMDAHFLNRLWAHKRGDTTECSANTAQAEGLCDAANALRLSIAIASGGLLLFVASTLLKAAG